MPKSKLANFLLLNLIIIPVFGLFTFYLLQVVAYFEGTIAFLLQTYLTFCMATLQVVILHLLYKDPGIYKEDEPGLSQETKNQAIESTFQVIDELKLMRAVKDREYTDEEMGEKPGQLLDPREE